MAASVVDVDRLPTGEVVCATTTRKKNAVWIGNGRGWMLLVEWSGKEVTACCACGPSVVCPALDGVLYIVTGGEVRTIPLSDVDAWFYGCRALDENRALMGGSNGRLAIYDHRSGAVERRKLLDFGVDKPGRTIHAVSAYDGRIFLTGKKNLLLEYREDEPIERATKAVFGGRELLFLGATPHAGRIWLSGFGMLAAVPDAGLPGDAVVWEEPLWGRNSRVGVRPFRDGLMAFQSTIVVGYPGTWRPLVARFDTGGLAAVEDSPIEGEIIAVDCAGKAYAIGEGAVRDIPIF
jgi:hypothetical protein